MGGFRRPWRIHPAYFRGKGKTIKSREVLDIISEVSESIALSENRNFIVQAVLDSLSENLGADCIWIQQDSLPDHRLSLVSYRGFTDELYRLMSGIDINHWYVQEAVGLGNNVVVPDLGADGRAGLAAFREAGLQSLMAVPVMTYKVLGVMGVAYRKRRSFGDEFARLLAVIANLVGMVLKRDLMAECPAGSPDDAPVISGVAQEVAADDRSREPFVLNVIKAGFGRARLSREEAAAFQRHLDRMENFRKLHR